MANQIASARRSFYWRDQVTIERQLEQKHCQLTIDDLKFAEGEEDELPARLRMVKAPKLGM